MEYFSNLFDSFYYYYCYYVFHSLCVYVWVITLLMPNKILCIGMLSIFFKKIEANEAAASRSRERHENDTDVRKWIWKEEKKINDRKRIKLYMNINRCEPNTVLHTVDKQCEKSIQS